MLLALRYGAWTCDVLLLCKAGGKLKSVIAINCARAPMPSTQTSLVIRDRQKPAHGARPTIAQATPVR